MTPAERVRAWRESLGAVALKARRRAWYLARRDTLRRQATAARRA